jgi:hypothetical protein
MVPVSSGTKSASTRVLDREDPQYPYAEASTYIVADVDGVAVDNF